MGEPSDGKTEDGLARREILEERLDHDGMSLWDAALIANGAHPATDASALTKRLRDAVYDTESILNRLIKLKPAKVIDGHELYETVKVFRELQKTSHRFPTLVAEVLIKKWLIRSQSLGQRKRHGNAERFENERIEVMKAMIRVLANPELNIACREKEAPENRVVGAALARKVIENQDWLFEDEKSPRQSGSIANLFNEIVPPQVN